MVFNVYSNGTSWYSMVLHGTIYLFLYGTTGIQWYSVVSLMLMALYWQFDGTVCYSMCILHGINWFNRATWYSMVL